MSENIHLIYTKIKTALPVRFIKYIIVGASSTIIDTVILAVCVEIIKLDPLVGKVIAQIFSITNGYYWNRKWTFKDRTQPVKWQYLRFIVVSILGVGISLIAFTFFTQVLSIWYIFANLLTTLVAVAWNFNINRLFTFK
jgi:putative flippase GtrA